MKKLFFLVSIILSCNVFAKNYFVANSGSDSNDGLTEATAWKTLNKVNANVNVFTPGDIILFKGGDQFYGTLIILNKNEITITSYGSGKAIITGGEKITGWTYTGNNIWRSTVSNKVHQIFKNGNVLSQARYPKIKDDFTPESNYYQITSTTSNTVFKCSNLIGMPNLIGASIQIQSAAWRFTSCKIKSFNSGSGQITLEKAPTHPIDIGDNFFVINDIDLLDTDGEWFYDKDKLYIHSTSAPTNIVGNTLDGIGVEIEKSDNITIENLSIRYYTEKGINAEKSNNLRINNNEFLYCYEYGIRTKSSPNTTVTNNYFKGGMRNGISLNEWNANTYFSNSMIRNNKIFEHGMLKQATARNFDIPQTINLHGSGDTMEYNDIQKVGYNGVRIYGSNVTVQYNFIKDFCLTAHDGGAIYSQANSFNGTTVDGGVIKNNIIINRDLGDKWFDIGIYADDRSKNIQILNNTVSLSKDGIYLHNTKNVTLKGNSVYNTRRYGLSFIESSQAGKEGEMVGNTVRNNDVLLEGSNVESLNFRSIIGSSGFFAFGNFSSNNYWNPSNLKDVRFNTLESKETTYTLKDWIPKYTSVMGSEQETGSTTDLDTTVKLHQLVYNKDTDSKAITLEGTWQDLLGIQYNSSITLEPYTSKILILVENKTGSIDANAGEDQTICLGESATLTVSGGSLYQWSTGATTSSIEVSPTETTTYTVTVTEAGVSATDEVIVTVNTVTAEAGQDVTINEGETVTLTASGGGSYVWSNGETTQSITVSPNNTSTFSVTVTNNGCEDTASVEVTVIPSTNQSVTANAGEDQTICLGESVTLTGSGGTTYEWSNGESTASITVSPSSTQTYTLTAIDGSNTDTDEIIVTVNTMIAEAGEDVTINEGESVTLTASGGDSYIWNSGENTESITVSPTKTTVYTVTVSKDGCDDSDTVQVLVNQSFVSDPPPASADAGEDVTICLGESVTLTANGGKSYLWSTGEANKNINVNPRRTTTYSLFATRGGVTDTDTIIVTVENCLNNSDDINLSLAVYPNPNDGNFQISINNIDGSINLFISDTKGSIVYSEILSGQVKNHTKEIDLSRFSKGIYFVRLLNANQNMVTKIVMI